ncbi:MAG: hypothetical protein KGZ80_12230 [Methylomonas sp.]|nr:hypothetical protein [Methylomonas sp.]
MTITPIKTSPRLSAVRKVDDQKSPQTKPQTSAPKTDEPSETAQPDDTTPGHIDETA